MVFIISAVKVRCGTDTDDNMINVRLNVINKFGIVATLNASAVSDGVTALSDSWYQVKKGQWVFGASLSFDMSAYLNSEVVILIEVDQPAEGNPTIWLDQMGFVA